MNEVEARARLALLVDATSEPVLDVPDLDDLLRRSSVRDVSNRYPEDEGWTPTYNLNHAASLGWKIKSGRLTNAYLFMSGGKMLSRNQMFEHCLTMSRRYAMAGGIGSVSIATSRDRRPLRDGGVDPPGLYIEGLAPFSGPNGTLEGVVTNWSPDERSN
jgi:hypothetical protein